MGGQNCFDCPSRMAEILSNVDGSVRAGFGKKYKEQQVILKLMVNDIS